MSLQIWMPLNGTMKNQGLLGDLIQTGTPTYVDGKTGKALVTGGCKMTAEQASQVMNNNEFSICFWIYVNADEGVAAGRSLFGNDNISSATNNRKYFVMQWPTVNDLHLSWQNNTANDRFLWVKLVGVLPSYKWTHIAVTYKNPNVTIYINGTKAGAFTGVSDSESFAYETNVISNGAEMVRFSDYRVYNNCISAKEVKEISKGLVLHYKLSGYGGENLIQNSYDCANWTLGPGFTKSIDPDDGSTVLSYTRTGSTANTWNRAYSNNIPKEKVIDSGMSISFDFKCDSLSGLTDTCIIALNTYNSSGTRIYWYEPRLTLNIKDGEWSHITVYWDKATLSHVLSQYTVNDISYFMVSWQLVRDGSVHFKKMKIEAGSKATAWCPNRSDPIFTSLGFNDGIERDCSGFGNDGTMAGTFLCDSNSARHEGSYIFTNSPTQYIRRPYLSFLTGPFTVSCWCYQTNVRTTHGTGTILLQFIVSQGRDYAPSSTESYGFNLESYNGTLRARIGRSVISTDINLLNAWHMCTLVYNGTTAYVYVDGIQKTSADITAPTYENTYDSFVVGKMSHAYTDTTHYFPFVGNISDVRIYATALSASDIRALYDNTISIHKNGTIYACDFKEE